MMDEYYRCTECGEVTAVRSWPATRYDPPDSTWGDGCKECGGVLEEQPEGPVEPDWDRIAEERLEARYRDDREEW